MSLHDDDIEPSRKRRRAARACNWCKSKKYRCDERNPCFRCTKAGIECVYADADPLRQRIDSQAWTNAVPVPPTPPSIGDPSIGNTSIDNIGNTRPDTASLAQDVTPAISRRNLNTQDGEVTEINPHTLTREFHGKTSSLGFLAALQRNVPSTSRTSELDSQALVSAFHNESFSPQAALHAESSALPTTKFYFRQSQYFLEAYFLNIHFIHPFIDRSTFYARCEDLWFGRNGSQTRGFIALYFAVMSLGALTREWSEDCIDGLGRWEWSRKFFQLASASLGPFPVSNDLETVQASIIMAKVCQNELSPSLAYTYLGLAVRTSLSAGHNRKSGDDSSADRTTEDDLICKTWWALYSVEVEMSFALGRPDSLGADFYHNSSIPAVETSSETSIIPVMVDFARIVRKVAASVYSQGLTIQERIDSAADVEMNLDYWILSLPDTIRPRLEESTDDTGMMKDPVWAKKQRHTLRFRYYNALMVLYRPFLLHVRHPLVPDAAGFDPRLNHALNKCVAAARSTISLMHHLYSTASYFRTWWYNTTYTLYAASIILGYRTRLASIEERPELLQPINMSIEILHAMDENMVARKAANLLREAIDQTQDATGQRLPTGDDVQTNSFNENGTADPFDHLDTGDFLFLPFDDNADFMAQIFPTEFL